MKIPESQFAELISTLAAILDLDENIKLYHAWRTALISYKMAQLIIPKKAIQVFYAGLLHDVGAVGLKDHIVHSKNSPDQKEQQIIFNHPKIGAKIVQEIPGLKQAAEYILDHHETYHGKGYPNKKMGDELSIGSQILYLADQLDLLIRDQSLKKTDIYNFFRLEKGLSFTKKLWPIFLDMLHSAGGTFFYLLKEKTSFLKLMHATLEEINQRPLHLPENFLDQTLKIFGQIIDAKDSYTHGHSERVVRYSLVIGQTINLPKEKIHLLKHGAYLHDIGKLGVSVSILNKEERLTDQELATVKEHVLITMEVLDSISFLRHLTEISGYHHTRWDGTGYPDRLAGEDIPLEARIICLGDSFDAMTSNRAYRTAQSFDSAWNELRKQAGRQFDPNLINQIDQPAVIEKFKKIYLSQFDLIKEPPTP